MRSTAKRLTVIRNASPPFSIVPIKGYQSGYVLAIDPTSGEPVQYLGISLDSPNLLPRPNLDLPVQSSCRRRTRETGVDSQCSAAYVPYLNESKAERHSKRHNSHVARSPGFLFQQQKIWISFGGKAAIMFIGLPWRGNTYETVKLMIYRNSHDIRRDGRVLDESSSSWIDGGVREEMMLVSSGEKKKKDNPYWET